MKIGMAAVIVLALGACVSAYAADDQEIKYDYVTETVSGVVNKAAAILTGQAEITVSPDNDGKPGDFTRDAIGRRVPKSTAVKSGQALHNDEPL